MTLMYTSKRPISTSLTDLPIFVRGQYANNASAFDLNDNIPMHVDIPRLKKGQVGGFFWSAFVACADWAGYEEGEDFLNSTWRVRCVILRQYSHVDRLIRACAAIPSSR